MKIRGLNRRRERNKREEKNISRNVEIKGEYARGVNGFSPLRLRGTNGNSSKGGTRREKEQDGGGGGGRREMNKERRTE